MTTDYENYVIWLTNGSSITTMHDINNMLGEEVDGKVAELHSVHFTAGSDGDLAALYVIAWVPSE